MSQETAAVHVYKSARKKAKAHIAITEDSLIEFVSAAIIEKIKNDKNAKRENKKNSAQKEGQKNGSKAGGRKSGP